MQALPGINYLPSRGFLTVGDGANSGSSVVNIENSAFLSLGSSFTVTLTRATYIGNDGEKPKSTVTRVSYGTIQFYLPPNRGDVPAIVLV